MNLRRWEPYAATALAGVALVSVNTLVDFGRLRPGSAIVVAVLAFAITLHRAVKALDGREFRRLLGYVSASLVLVVACVAIGEGATGFVMAGPVTRLVLAWAFVLTLLAPEYEAGGVRFLPSLNVGLVAAGAALLWLTIAHATGGIRPYVIDEVLYLLQSNHVWHPPFMQPLDPHLVRFFALQQAYARDGYLNGQYPPGWPLALALLPGALGHPLLLLGIHVALVVATYVLGRMLASRGVGLIAAALVSVSGFELYFSMSFFSEVFTTTLLTAAAVSLIAGFRATQRRAQYALWSAAGLAAAWAGTARPLTGLALWAAAVLFALLVERPSRRRAAVAGGAMLAGAVLPTAYLLWYNLRTTGSPVHFGYALAQRGFQALGFGARGFVRYDGGGRPYLDVAAFGARDAVVNTAKTMEQAFARFWPASLVLPLVFLARHVAVRIRWRLVAPFALLPAAYFFYFYGGPRFLFELLPLAMIGTAWLLVEIWQRRPRAAAAATAVMLVSALAATHPWLAAREYWVDEFGPALRAIGRERGQHPRMLVFVRDLSSDPAKPFFTAAYAYNFSGDFHGPVVVARDLGESDTTLIAHYPGYAPFRLVFGTRASGSDAGLPGNGYEFVPFADSAAMVSPAP